MRPPLFLDTRPAPPTEDDILAALAALPPTPDEVAALFEDLDIKGHTAHACACPLAVYLAQEFPAHARDVTVYHQAHVGDVWVKTPWHLYAFAQAFDRGAYPALLKGRGYLASMAAQD